MFSAWKKQTHVSHTWKKPEHLKYLCDSFKLGADNVETVAKTVIIEPYVALSKLQWSTKIAFNQQMQMDLLTRSDENEWYQNKIKNIDNQIDEDNPEKKK